METDREGAVALENEIEETINGLYGFSDEELRVIRQVTMPPEALYGMEIVNPP